MNTSTSMFKVCTVCGQTGIPIGFDAHPTARCRGKLTSQGYSYWKRRWDRFRPTTTDRDLAIAFFERAHRALERRREIPDASRYPLVAR